MTKYADIYINVGETFELEISLGVEYASIEVFSAISRSYTSERDQVSFTVSPHDTDTTKAILSLTAEETENLKIGRSVYDVFINGESGTARIQEGQVHVSPKATTFEY